MEINDISVEDGNDFKSIRTNLDNHPELCVIIVNMMLWRKNS